MNDESLDDAGLLARFARERDEAAFAELVRRHLGLVYSAALRLVGGDAHGAQDVAQAVFVDLAGKASGLACRPGIAGWLYTSTHHAAANFVRAGRRRRQRELDAHAMHETNDEPALDVAWAAVRPVLDDALRHLKSGERETLLLRFFEGRSFSEIATRLAMSESGVRMRVDRALEKLRARLERHGVRSTAAALATVLSAHAVAAPPIGMAATITSTVLAGSTATTGAALAIFGMTKIQIALVATLAATGSVALVWQKHERASLLTELQARPAAPNAVAQRVEAGYSGASQSGATTVESPEIVSLRARKTSLLAQLAQFATPPAAPLPGPDVATRQGHATGRNASVSINARVRLDAMPEPKVQSAPDYPVELKEAGIPGEARVSFVIASDGTVHDVAPEDATHPLFAMAAMDAIARSTFAPGLKGGRPVNTRLQQSFQFHPTDPEWFSP